MSNPLTGLPYAYVDGVTPYQGQHIELVHGLLETQLVGLISSLELGVHEEPYGADSFEVTEGTGLEVLVAPGSGVVPSASHGHVIVAKAVETEVALPASSTRYIYAASEFTDDNDSRTSKLPRIHAAESLSASNGVLLATVVTSGSAVTSITDGRTFVGLAPTGAAGEDGEDGADGEGVPAGGTTGQVLAKASGTDYDTEWVDAAEDSGAATTLGGQSSAYHLSRTNHTGTQAISTVTGLQAALDAKAATSHTHAIADTTGLQAALDGKAATSHTHTIANVTGLQDALDDVEEAANTDHSLNEIKVIEADETANGLLLTLPATSVGAGGSLSVEPDASETPSTLLTKLQAIAGYNTDIDITGALVEGDASESSWVVSGAGNTAYNGEYVYTGTNNGAPYGTNENGKVRFYGGDNKWYIGDDLMAVGGSEEHYSPYSADGTVSGPTGAYASAAPGENPPPTEESFPRVTGSFRFILGGALSDENVGDWTISGSAPGWKSRTARPGGGDLGAFNAAPITVVSTNLTMTQAHQRVVMDSPVTVRTITLPDAEQSYNRRFVLMNAGTASCTVNTAGDDEIIASPSNLTTFSITTGETAEVLGIPRADGTFAYMLT